MSIAEDIMVRVVFKVALRLGEANPKGLYRL